MDTEYHALLKLKKNPHYKMSAKQLAKLAEYDRDPIVLFGIAPTHPNTFEPHAPLRKIAKK